MIIFIAGCIMCAVAFVLALINMGRDDPSFQAHLACMGGVAVGGIVTLIGLVKMVVEVLQRNGWM